MEDRADRVYFLKTGQVVIRTAKIHGRDFVLQLVEAGHPFGELCCCSVIGGLRHSAAYAVTESAAIEIALNDFVQYLKADQGALLAFMFGMCLRLTEARRNRESAKRLRISGQLRPRIVTSSVASERGAEFILPLPSRDSDRFVIISQPTSVGEPPDTPWGRRMARREPITESGPPPTGQGATTRAADGSPTATGFRPVASQGSAPDGVDQNTSLCRTIPAQQARRAFDSKASERSDEMSPHSAGDPRQAEAQPSGNGLR